MKQRACIAIAISLKPQLIIADEPTSALDVITQRQVMDTLCSVQERIGCGLILIGHDMGLMAQVADRMIVMQDGLIAEIAPVRELFRNPRHSYSRMLIESVPSLAKDQFASASGAGLGRARNERTAAGAGPCRQVLRRRDLFGPAEDRSRALHPASRWRGPAHHRRGGTIGLRAKRRWPV